MSDPIRQEVMLKYKGRCIFPVEWFRSPEDIFIITRFCMHPAIDVHEIETRSRNPGDWNRFENRVPLCHEHHMEYHQNTGKYKLALIAAQSKMLEYLDE